MSKGFSTLKVKPAINGLNSFNLDFTHRTTMDFGQILPIMYHSMIPRDKIQVNMQSMMRMATMKFPTYGDIQMRFVYGFVPYYQLSENIESFFAGQRIYQGKAVRFPYITIADLIDFVVTLRYNVIIKSGTESDCDLLVYNGNEKSYYKFNYNLKYYIKILSMLGYNLPQGADVAANSTWRNTVGKKKLNILNLLSYFKFYNDWLSQMTTFNSSILTDYLRKIKNGDSSIISDDGHLKLGLDAVSPEPNRLFAMFSQIKVPYGSDYFTTMWDNVGSPTSSNSPLQSTIDPLDGSNKVTINDESTYVTTYDSSDLTALQLRLLQSLDSWIRRNSYSGTMAANNIYARFGVRPDEFRSDYARLISKDTVSVRIGDVTQTSGSDSANGSFLGDYAGKGYMQGGSNVSFDTSDYGCFLCLAYIYPKVTYSGGMHHEVFKTQVFDFYNPEFDGVGVEAVTYDEVWSNPKDDDSSKNKGQNVFGFMERYNDMRFKRDLVTGDFSYYADFDAWHLNRNMNGIRQHQLTPQASATCTMRLDDKGNSEYDRIFNVINADAFNTTDHFYLDFDFKVNALRPIKNSSQVANLGDGKLELDRLGLRKV